MASHHRTWTAHQAVFECACGWQSESTDTEKAADEFDQHFSDIGYRFGNLT